MRILQNSFRHRFYPRVRIEVIARAFLKQMGCVAVEKETVLLNAVLPEVLC